LAAIATMLPDARALQRVNAAVKGEHRLVHCRTWEELEEACKDDEVSLAIIDLFADGQAHFDMVRRLKMRAERLTLVAYVSLTSDRARDLFDAGRAGFDGLLILGHDDTPAAFRAVLERASARGAAQLLRPHLIDVDPLVRDAVMVAVTRAHLRLTSHRLAEICGAPKRSLLSALEKAGFPPPQKLLAWGRLIVAAQMLEDPARAADAVARQLDFPSGSAFRNTCQRYLGATPHEIRGRGGAAWAAGKFLTEIGPTSKP
jgi:methylphosphotriester-DNA--protein-cysteine methyltransferase